MEVGACAIDICEREGDIAWAGGQKFGWFWRFPRTFFVDFGHIAMEIDERRLCAASDVQGEGKIGGLIGPSGVEG